MLLPRWAYFNIYAMSSWTRTIVIPLSIFYAHKPCRRVPPEQGIAELFLQPPHTPMWPHPPTRRLVSWTNFFLGVDWLIKKFDGCRLVASARRACSAFHCGRQSGGAGTIKCSQIACLLRGCARGPGRRAASSGGLSRRCRDHGLRSFSPPPSGPITLSPWPRSGASPSR